MFNNLKIALRILALLVLLCSPDLKLRAQQNPLTDSRGIYLADPTVFYQHGTYYLYGTVGGDANQGFIAYTSPDLKTWEKSEKNGDGYVLRKGDAWGTAGFWAPQVFAYGGKFYMAYVANENIALAESSSPLGPFIQKTKSPLAAPVKQIDPFVFIDDDGKKYLYHVRLTGGNKIFVAELTEDFSALKEETLRACITATEPWENTAGAAWPVTEGPTVLKHNNLYYLFYTANDFRNPDYATGYATSTSPYGPWKKFEGNPVLSRKNIGVNGTGHGDFVRDKRNNLFYVFHTHYSDSAVAPRRTAIIKTHFLKDPKTGMANVRMDEKTVFFLAIKKN